MMRRKQYDAFRKLVLPPREWCDLLGVRMMVPNGWTESSEPKAYEAPVSLPEFVRRAFSSSLAFEDGSCDLHDCENYAAEDGDL